MHSELLLFNGINGASGDYLLPPMNASEISKIAQGETFDEKHLNELKWRHQQLSAAHFGVKEGVDPKSLAETGWGVIFAHNADPAIKEASANCWNTGFERRLKLMSTIIRYTMGKGLIGQTRLSRSSSSAIG